MAIATGSMDGGWHEGSMRVKKALRLVNDAIYRLQTANRINTEPTMLVVFYLPGQSSKPDHVGLGKARFSRKQQGVAVAVAFTDEMMLSTKPEQLMLDSIREAVRLSGPKFARHKMEFSIKNHLAFLDDVERAVANTHD